MATIDLHNVSQVFVDSLTGRNTVALENVSFVINTEETVALLGPSGCGKSTILNIVAGFLQPTAGDVKIDGQKITKPGPDRGVVFQEHFLFHWLTVEANVAFALKLRGEQRATYLAQARDYIRRVRTAGLRTPLSG